jgi:chromosomal replication initiator protein
MHLSVYVWEFGIGAIEVTQAERQPSPQLPESAPSTGPIKESWARCLQRLRFELGDDLYNSWFARVECETFAGGQLIVSVPTRFLKSWIDNHYLAKFQKVAATEFTGLATVAVKVRGAQMQQQRPVSAVPRSAKSLAEINQHQGFGFAEAVKPFSKTPDIDENQTFANFMVGPANQLAHAAASRVAQATAGQVLSFNPLYIHAPAGLGKSHLLNAIAHHMKTTNNPRRVMMLTAERFMYGFIQAIRARDTLSFKDQFQSVDVLLIDDFQFLQGKATQQEFCHAFNSLVDQRRQVVVAADVPPVQLEAIDQRMRSRLMGGLVIDIETPDETLRRKIVGSRYDVMTSRDPSQRLPDEILDLIANRISGSCRELEGALNRVIAYQQFNNQPITMDLASMVLRDAQAQGSTDPGRIKIDDILKIVGRHFNVAKADLLSPRRARTVVVPRQIGMYLAKKLTTRSLPEIGRRFGGRDHSTVLHAVRKIDEQIRSDEKLAKDVALLIRLVEQQP